MSNNTRNTWNHSIPYFRFSISNNRFLSALSCLLVLDNRFTLPFWVRREGSALYWLGTDTSYSSGSDCRWISLGVGEVLPPIISSPWIPLSLRISEWNFWLSIKYHNAGSSSAEAAMNQLHCTANRYWRCGKVTNNLANVHRIISTSFSKVLLIEKCGAGLPLQS